MAARTPVHRPLHQLLACMLLLLMSCCLPVRTQLEIIAITPSPQPGDASVPNTVMGTVGTVIPAAQLTAGTQALLWGAVPSSAVIAACELIVNSGQDTLTANISNDWGGSEYLTLEVVATSGCLAETDASGTEIAFVDTNGHYCDLICPSSNVSSTGCGVYLTGSDIDAIYNSWDSGSNSLVNPLLHPASSRSMLAKLRDPVEGRVTGVMTEETCAELTPLAAFCVPGELGVRRPCICTGGHCCNCFPGDALVRTRNGGMKSMSQLQLGDQVAVRGPNGAVVYDDVYAFGHKDAQANSIFTTITAQPITEDSYANTTTTIRLTDYHFLPTSTSSAGNLVYKRAKDVQVGDFIWAAYHSTSAHNTLDGSHVKIDVLPARVKGISTTFGRGLYNPLTLGGTMIVDDIVASVHSDWFLDGAFDIVDLPHWLPSAYQFVLAPVRGLYKVLGKKAYIFLYEKLDSYLNIPEFGTNYGGTIALGACATLITTIATPLFMRVLVPAQNA